MTTVLNPASAPPRRTAPYKVDISRGSRIGRVSSEWFSRPDDERFLSLRELHAATLARAQHATTRTVETRDVRVEASRDDAERLALIVPGRDEPVAPTHWSFGQLCSLVGAPSGYLRELPAPLAGINLQHGLLSHRAELMKTLETEDGRTELRAVTGPEYGRIWDHELVAAVMKIAGNGTGDTRWKVPGLLDWSTMTHNPHVEVTRDTTTLYASDRDVFLFLVDDAHPIEAGTRMRVGWKAQGKKVRRGSCGTSGEAKPVSGHTAINEASEAGLNGCVGYGACAEIRSAGLRLDPHPSLRQVAPTSGHAPERPAHQQG